MQNYNIIGQSILEIKLVIERNKMTARTLARGEAVFLFCVLNCILECPRVITKFLFVESTKEEESCKGNVCKYLVDYSSL